MNYKLLISIIIIIIIFIILNYNTKEEFYNYVYTPEELFRHLSFVSYVLTMNKIKHWLIYGTLLGAVRNQDIIPYDYDFDLGAQVEDTDKILALNDVIDKYGYKFERAFNNNLWKVSLKIYFKGIPMGDIYLYHKFADGLMRRYDPITGTYFWPKGTFPYYFIEDLQVAKIKNNYFPMPKDPEILLEYYYGKTWRTPIKAKAQGGKGSESDDYYGGAKSVSLSFLLNHLKKKGIILRPNIDKKVNYVFPKDQESWIKSNEFYE